MHWDNARPHQSGQTKGKIAEIGPKLLNIPHTPDLAPSDFFLFGFLKTRLKGKRFQTHDQLVMAVKAEIASISKETLARVLEEWIQRLRRAIETGVSTSSIERK